MKRKYDRRGRPIFIRSRREAKPKESEEKLSLSQLVEKLPAAVEHILSITGQTGLLQSVSHETLSLRMFPKEKIPSLPPGYFYKGGVARELLRRLLHPNSGKLPIRDYDLFRFAETDDSHDHELSLRLMEQDYEHARGVEVVPDEATYFATRDITANEVLFTKGVLTCSFRALEDSYRALLVPTPYVTDAEGTVDVRTVLKCLRLSAEGLVRNVDLFLPEGINYSDAKPFHVALQLGRALETGNAAAEQYLEQVWQSGIYFSDWKVPPKVPQAVARLGSRIIQGPEFFDRFL